jgi:hypothetical protein
VATVREAYVQGVSTRRVDQPVVIRMMSAL